MLEPKAGQVGDDDATIHLYIDAYTKEDVSNTSVTMYGVIISSEVDDWIA